MKLMIVDDHAAVRGLIRSIVQEFADEIQECANGNDAAAVCSEFRPNLVLTDIAMEGMNGIALTGLIRANYPEVQVMVVTAFDDVSLRLAAEIAGAKAYVLKEDLTQLAPLVAREARR